MAQTSVGEIGLDLVVNQNQFKKQMNGIQSLAKKAGAALAAAFAVKKVVQFGKACLDLGSDLQEVQNVVDVTFPSMTAKVDEFAKSAAASFGLSETMAKQYTGTFGAMAKAFGFSESAAYDMGSTLTGLAGDVASFYNITQDEAYTKLKSVFTGETETLKDLGIVMTQNALDAYAMANGYGKTTAAMTEAEKVALRYAFVQNQLSAAQGDFTRTSDGWANQVRILKLQFDSLRASIGQGLINVLTPVIKGINTLLGKLTTAANAFKSFTELLTGKKSGGSSSVANPVSDLTAAADNASTGLTDASGAADSLSDSTSGVGTAAKKAAKEMRSLMGFDQINKLTKQDTSGDSGSSGSSSPSGSTGVGTALGDAVDYGSLAEGETVVDKLDSKFSKFLENIQRGIQPTINALKRLKSEGLDKLGKFTWTALKDFYNHFLVPVAKWTFGKGLPRFIDALNDGLMKIDYQKINDGLSRLWDALAPFAIHVGEGLLWLWEKVLVPLGTWTANEVVPRFLDTLSIVIETVNTVIEALKPLFQWFWDSVLLPIAQWTGGIFLTIWDGINGALQKFSDWCGEHQTAVQNIAIAVASFFAAWKISSFVSSIAGFITTAVNVVSSVKSIAGALSLLKTGIGAVVGVIGGPLTIGIAAAIAAGILLYKNWDAIKQKAQELWEKVKTTFESIKTSITEKLTLAKETANRILDKIKEKFSEIWDSVKKVVSKVIEAVQAKIGGTLGDIYKAAGKKLNSIKESFETVFQSVKGTVESIFNGIWDTIRGVINSILGGVESMANGVIDAVNSIAGAFNSIQVQIPDWVPVYGGGTLGFNLPTFRNISLPRLAEGGYVKANTPQLAMIGDNRHQGEIVAPEDKLLDMARMAAKMEGTNGVTREELETMINNAVMRIVAALTDMGFSLDGETVAKAEIAAKVGINRRFNLT